MIKYFTLLLILISINTIKAQVIDQDQLAKITYDYNKDQLTGKMPFDDYFKIIYKGIEYKNITKVYLFELKYKKDILKVRTTRKARKGDELPDIARRFQNLTVSKSKESDHSSQSIVAPLDPERAYVITIFKKNSNSNHIVFNTFLDLVTKPASVEEQINFFNRNIIPLNDNLDKLTIPIGSFPNDFSNFVSKIAPILEFYNNPANQPDMNSITMDAVITPSLISIIANNFKTQEIKSKTFKEIMPMFLNDESGKIQSFSVGINDEVKAYNYSQRIAKLKSNIQVLENLKREIEELQLIQNDSNIQVFSSNFVIKAIKTLKSNLKNLTAFNSKLKNLINKYLPEIILMNATTLGNDLKTSNSSSLVPDVGLLNALGYNSKGDLKYIARPYLGLNWHFSGINRSQYLREIPNKKFRHRWSLSLGITLGKIDTEDYEDFYNGISPTIGMNYRLTRQIRIGGGTMLVREKNLNPIVENTKIEFAPYISMSFDLGLLSEASKLTKLIGF